MRYGSQDYLTGLFAYYTQISETALRRCREAIARDRAPAIHTSQAVV
jgi:hypothetical protein